MIPPAISATLAMGKAAIESLLVSSATVFRKSTVSDGAGGQIDSYTEIGTFPCLYEKYPVRTMETEREPLIRVLATWQFTFKRDVVLEQTDRLEVDGRSFEVVGQGIGTNSMANHAMCLEIL